MPNTKPACAAPSGLIDKEKFDMEIEFIVALVAGGFVIGYVFEKLSWRGKPKQVSKVKSD
jgi:hypothetical protein